MKQLLRVSLGLAALAVVGFIALITWARSAPRPGNLGITQGRLAACPPTPNCVATEQASADQQMSALSYTTTQEAARERLLELVRATPRTTIVTAEDCYIAAEFRMPIIGFIDDVEFRFDDSAKVIHFRSASRLGRDDLGVNRTRMEAISRSFNAQPISE